jgi:hypothetical protein
MIAAASGCERAGVYRAGGRAVAGDATTAPMKIAAVLTLPNDHHIDNRLVHHWSAAGLLDMNGSPHLAFRRHCERVTALLAIDGERGAAGLVCVC